MIHITDGFTSITVGTDPIAAPMAPAADDARSRCRHAPTGVRVTLTFSRDTALPPDQPVTVQYEFGDGAMRQAVGIPLPTHVETKWRRGVIFHYRLSYWIPPQALSGIAAGNVRQRTEEAREHRHDFSDRSSVTE